MTLVEGLVAAGILAVVAFGVMQIFATYSKKSMVLEGRSECRQRAQALIAPFKNNDNKLRIDNPYMAIGQAASERRSYLFPLLSSPITFQSTNAWMSIDGGSNWALALYNQANAPLL